MPATGRAGWAEFGSGELHLGPLREWQGLLLESSPDVSEGIHEKDAGTGSQSGTGI